MKHNLITFNCLAHGSWTACGWFANVYGIVPKYRSKVQDAVNKREWSEMWQSLTEDEVAELTKPTIRYAHIANEIRHRVNNGAVALLQEVTTELLEMLMERSVGIAAKVKYSNKMGGIYTVIAVKDSDVKDWFEVDFITSGGDKRTSVAEHRKSGLTVASRHSSGYWLREPDLDKLHASATIPYIANTRTLEILKQHSRQFILGGDFNTFPEAHPRNNIFTWAKNNGISVGRTNTPTELPRSGDSPNNELDYFFSYGVEMDTPTAETLVLEIPKGFWDGPVSDHMMVNTSVSFKDAGFGSER